ncbi:TPA: putative protein YneK [Escherichia albertii]|nr:putative protein YneK [Escherichia albertii]
MIRPVSVSNYISISNDFPVNYIPPQIKDVLKSFIDALSIIICDEEWRTSLRVNSITKNIFDNLDNLSYTQQALSQDNDSLYNESVHLFLNDFIEQFPMISIGIPIKRAHTPHIEPLAPDHHAAADYLRQFDLLVMNFISRGNFVIFPGLWNKSEIARWFANTPPNLITTILNITDDELKHDLLQSLMDSLCHNKHILPEVCICFLSLLADSKSPHFQELFLFFSTIFLNYQQYMNPNENDLNDMLIPASLNENRTIRHLAKKMLKLITKKNIQPKVIGEDFAITRPRSPVSPTTPSMTKTPVLSERH